MSPSGSEPCRESWIASAFKRREGAAARVEAPPRVVVDLAGGELELDDPAGRLLPARPAFAGSRRPRPAWRARRRRKSGARRGSSSAPSSTGTARACPTTCSRSARTGPSKRAMSSTRAPSSAATSSADSPARMCAWISRGLGRTTCASPSRSLRALRSSTRSTSSTASENRSPDSVDQDEHVVLGSDDFELFHAKRPSDPAVCAHADTAVAPRREYPARAASFTATQDREPDSRICEMGSGRANYRRPTGSVHHCYSPEVETFTHGHGLRRPPQDRRRQRVDRGSQGARARQAVGLGRCGGRRQPLGVRAARSGPLRPRARRRRAARSGGRVHLRRTASW